MIGRLSESQRCSGEVTSFALLPSGSVYLLCVQSNVSVDSGSIHSQVA